MDASMLRHIDWLTSCDKQLHTSDGRQVFLWKFSGGTDSNVWSSWAKHFRSQYIADDLIDLMKKGTAYEGSRADYLMELVFPDKSVAPGPSVRSGDFCEVLVADLLERNFKFFVPRTRFSDKSVRNESPKGSDIVAIRMRSEGSHSPHDVLAIYEVKGKLTGKLDPAKSRLQDAINDSCKDLLRASESLNAAKRKLILREMKAEADVVERFQDAADRPYTYIPGAAAVVSSCCWNESLLRVTSCEGHPFSADLHLLVIEADDFMEVARHLYDLAANEA